MTPETRNMKQVATYWAPLANDGFGGMTFDSPITILCRWQNVAQLFRDTHGREVTSSSIVYPNQELEVRGYLALGDQTATPDPRSLVDAEEIRQVGQSPSLDAVRVLYKAFI